LGVLKLEIKDLVGKVVGINKVEKLNSKGNNEEKYKITIEFDGFDYEVKVAITTEYVEIAEQFRLNQEFRLSIQPANKTLDEFG
jgi:hypothetical protein